MHQDPVVIVAMARTPIGCMQGVFNNVSATTLGAVAIKAAVDRAKINSENIAEVIMGCVLSAGLGQAPARQAALGAGLAPGACCTTVNKMCGSGMQAIMLAYNALMLGEPQVIVAGGLESMSNAPYLLTKARGGYRLGHGKLIDHLLYDGLEDAYHPGTLMGVFADATAAKYNFTRAAQDEFATHSLQRAQQALAQGYFAAEIATVVVQDRKNKQTISSDEQPGRAKIDNIAKLRPAFSQDGTVTAANASTIADGAAALVLTRLSYAEKNGLTPLAKIVAHSSHANPPQWFTTAPIGAINKLFAKTGWQQAMVDLFEINEAFACVTMVAMHELNLPQEKVNIHGGACALGHPIGASGARIVVTLLAALQKNNLSRGIAALCIGGGEATALAIERIQ